MRQVYDFKEILNRLKLAKRISAMTLADIAEESGIPIGTLNKVFSGDTTEPKLPTIISIADALNISLDWLIWGKSAEGNMSTATEVDLPQIMKYQRKKLGLTLRQISEKVGVTEATVQRWESGRVKNLRKDKVIELSAILQISPSALMGWVEPNASAVEDSLGLRLRRLNSAGLKKLFDYADDLTEIKRYTD